LCQPPDRYRRLYFSTIFFFLSFSPHEGMFALPRVFGALGLIGGAVLVILVCIATYSTIAIMLRSSELSQQWTYASAMHAVYGRRAAAAVHAAVIAGCIGFVALYLIITCDVSLVGDKWQSRI
jgi:amino acid permease